RISDRGSGPLESMPLVASVRGLGGAFQFRFEASDLGLQSRCSRPFGSSLFRPGKHQFAGPRSDEPKHGCFWDEAQPQFLGNHAPAPVGSNPLKPPPPSAKSHQRAFFQVLASGIEYEILPHARRLVILADLIKVLFPGSLGGHLEANRWDRPALAP